MSLVSSSPLFFFFFFSSRRRHTRFDCDWSSDVCSSDLMSTERIIVDESVAGDFLDKLVARASSLPLGDPRKGPVVLGSVVDMATVERANRLIDDALAKGARLLCGGKARSEERRVGKECR